MKLLEPENQRDQKMLPRNSILKFKDKPKYRENNRTEIINSHFKKLS